MGLSDGAAKGWCPLPLSLQQWVLSISVLLLFSFLSLSSFLTCSCASQAGTCSAYGSESPAFLGSRHCPECPLASPADSPLVSLSALLVSLHLLGWTPGSLSFLPLFLVPHPGPYRPSHLTPEWFGTQASCPPPMSCLPLPPDPKACCCNSHLDLAPHTHPTTLRPLTKLLKMTAPRGTTC